MLYSISIAVTAGPAWPASFCLNTLWSIVWYPNNPNTAFKTPWGNHQEQIFIVVGAASLQDPGKRLAPEQPGKFRGPQDPGNSLLVLSGSGRTSSGSGSRLRPQDPRQRLPASKDARERGWTPAQDSGSPMFTYKMIIFKIYSIPVELQSRYVHLQVWFQITI